MNQSLLKSSGRVENIAMKSQVDEILALSARDRLQVVGQIWDSIAASPEEIPLTVSQRKDLDRRRREHRRDPSAAKTWSEIKNRLEKRHR